MSALRVAFAGASGTGKTTLARWVAETWDLPVNPAGSRNMAATMGFVDANGAGLPYAVDQANGAVYDRMLRAGAGAREAAQESLRDQPLQTPTTDGYRVIAPTVRPLFQRNLQAAKIAWESQRENFVTDRTSLDDLAYAILHCPEVVDADFYVRAHKWMEQYTHVFFCPVAVFHATGADPARVEDPTYHRIYDALVHGLLRAHPFVELSEADLDARMLLIRQWLR